MKSKIQDTLKYIYEQQTNTITIGKHNDVPDSEFDSYELELGIRTEHEHTDSYEIAKGIAKDHLSEIPGTGRGDGYYSLLKKMEKKAGDE